MKSKNQDVIYNKIQDALLKGQADSLLQKLEFDYNIKTLEEFSNFVLILLILIENPYCFAASSNLLLRRTLTDISKFSFLEDIEEAFSVINDNKILPYKGLSETIRRMISTVIYKGENDLEIISKWPDKIYLVNFNTSLLEDYLKIDNPSSSNALTLLYGCIFHIDSEKKVSLSPHALMIFKKYLENTPSAFAEYLHNFIRFNYFSSSRQWDDGKLIVPEPFYDKIFDSTESFLNFIRKHVSKNNIDETKNKIYLEIEIFIKEYVAKKHVYYDRVSITPEIHYNLKREL